MQFSNPFVANCDTIFSEKTFNLERHLTTCSQRLENISPTDVYQIHETLFDQLNSFDIKYTSQEKHFKLLEVFNFCPKTFIDMMSTKYKGKHIPILAPFLQTLWKDLPFLQFGSSLPCCFL